MRFIEVLAMTEEGAQKLGMKPDQRLPILINVDDISSVSATAEGLRIVLRGNGDFFTVPHTYQRFLDLLLNWQGTPNAPYLSLTQFVDEPGVPKEAAPKKGAKK